MGKWLRLGSVVALLIALALTTRWWFPPLLSFVGANTDVIQGLADLVQIALWIIAGAALLFGAWRQRQTPLATGQPSRSYSATADDESVIAQNKGVAARQIAVGGNVEGDVILIADPNDLWQYIRRKPPAEDLRRATETYLRHLVDRYRYLDFRGMGISDRVSLRLPLDEMYVPLKARIELPEGETWARQLRLGGRTPTEEEAEAMGQRLSEPRPLLELLTQNDGLIVLGDPGAGKTTFLKYLTLLLASGKTGQTQLTPRLPILISLSAYANALADKDIPLDRFIAGYFRDRGIDLPLNAMLEEALAQGGALLLLDGLDEVKDQSQRRLVVERVVDFFTVQRRKGNKFILTSRIVGYREVRPTVDGLSECTIVDFGDEEITLFVDKWTTAIENAARGSTQVAVLEAERERTELLYAVRHNPGVRDLATNPLLLTILALMKRQGVALPERRVELYQKYVDTLLRHWLLARSLDRPAAPHLDLVETLRILAPLALWMHETSPGVGLVKQGDLERRLTAIYAERNDPDPERSARQFLTDVREHAGLLLERGPREYGFIHLTFQEYLAAVAIAQQGQRSVDPIVDTLSAHIGDQTWHEVSLLTVGYLGIVQQRDEVAGDVVSALIQQPKGKPGEAIILAGEAVLDAWPGGVTRTCRQTAVNALLTTLRDDTHVSPILRAKAGDVLGNLGDPRFRADFHHLPDDPMLGFIEIPAGPFKMGESSETHELTLPTFHIARYPVTVAQFRAYVDATGIQPERAESLRDPANRPVRYVTWHEAVRYCGWLTDTLRSSEKTPPELRKLLDHGCNITLPSEAEWEKAGRGSDSRRYPWGDDINANFVNYDDTKIGDTSAVGCFPGGASPYGIEEMSGNVWEWTRSLREKYPYPADERDRQKRESLKGDGARVLRGGAFSYNGNVVRCASRSRIHPYYRGNDIGFRVVLV
ncbi:SUMF1/EgtB/PvdO family nonheme iron enzyme [bacterium]|nr:SUMF1/EgtB/PvdO family nonheme iron enzyme [bacterium]